MWGIAEFVGDGLLSIEKNSRRGIFYFLFSDLIFSFYLFIIFTKWPHCGDYCFDVTIKSCFFLLHYWWIVIPDQLPKNYFLLIIFVQCIRMLCDFFFNFNLHFRMHHLIVFILFFQVHWSFYNHLSFLNLVWFVNCVFFWSLQRIWLHEYWVNLQKWNLIMIILSC